MFGCVVRFCAMVLQHMKPWTCKLSSGARVCPCCKCSKISMFSKIDWDIWNLRVRQANCGKPLAAQRPTAASRQRQADNLWEAAKPTAARRPFAAKPTADYGLKADSGKPTIYNCLMCLFKSFPIVWTDVESNSDTDKWEYTLICVLHLDSKFQNENWIIISIWEMQPKSVIDEYYFASCMRRLESHDAMVFPSCIIGWTMKWPTMTLSP